MNDSVWLRAQIGEMRGLLEQSADDPISGPQWRGRIAEFEAELAEVLKTELPRSPQTAIHFTRDDEQEIDLPARTAADLLASHEAMFVALFRAAESPADWRGEPVAEPTLLLDGTLTQPCGFMWSCPRTRDDALRARQTAAFERLDEAIVAVVGLSAGLETLPPGLLRPLGRFLLATADLHCGLRLISPRDTVRELGVGQVRFASERLTQEVVTEVRTVAGVFRGLTGETGRFTLEAGGKTLTATLADDLTAADLACFAGMIDRPCLAEIETIAITRRGMPTIVRHALRNLTVAEVAVPLPGRELRDIDLRNAG